MPTPTKGARLGGSPAHQRLMLSNLATNLFEHGRIVTTETKARRLRPFAERLITKAKRDTLHSRRQVLAVIRDKGVVHELFVAIGPRYATRPGGYTRITKIGPRKGDNAPMAVIELVEERDFATSTAATSTAGTAPAAAAQVEDTAAAPDGGTGPDPSPDTSGNTAGSTSGDAAVADTTVPTPDEAPSAPADDTEATTVDGDIREEEVPTVAGDGGSPAEAADAAEGEAPADGSGEAERA